MQGLLIAGDRGTRFYPLTMNAPGAPAISVIIPVYNVEAYLPRCLDSVLGQTFRDIEVICVNDGSIDSSLEILHTYAQKDSRVRVIDQERKGIAAARNTGLEIARGQWISFVDSDDAVRQDIYESLLSHCLGDAEAICFSAQELTDTVPHQEIKSGYFDVKFSGFIILEDNDLLRLSATVWDKLYLRSKVEELHLRFPEGVWYEDNAFIWNYFSLCRKTFFVKDKLYFYYRRDGSFMTKSREKTEGLALHYISIIENIHDFWLSHGLLPAKQYLFEKASLFLFRAAIASCPPWEVAGIIYRLSLFLRHCSFIPNDFVLRSLYEGTYRVSFGTLLCERDVYSLRKLRGLENIFYIGNAGHYKIVKIFGIKIASWKR